jgi:4-amino-4-deoxy-L-arabinose transferase-like glycosyltransferase
MDGSVLCGHFRLSLVLPALNEEAGIRQAIAEADCALAGLCDDYEILVVDDGSDDATSAIVVEESVERPRVRLLRHPSNLGYGAALRTGFAAARFDLVAFTDADCQFHLEDLGRLLPLTAEHPIAAGYRLDRKDPWRRRFLSGGFNLLIRILLGTRVRDCDCALKVFRREALTDLLPETNGFFVNAEMLAKARLRGHSVAEAGVRHRPRLRGVSKVSMGQVPRVLGMLLPFWWTRMLFAGPDTVESSSPTIAPSIRRTPSIVAALALVMVVASLLFFTKLRAPLLEPQEPRYAEIPRQMLQEGRFIVPVLHGEAYLDKPPLLYWLTMASYSTFGVSDQSARLVPGIAGVLTVLLTFLWGRRIAGDRAGLCGALILCLSPGFIYRERMLTFDSILCLCVTMALSAAHVALSGSKLRRGWWIVSAIACGLGLLTKGPVALVLVAVPILAYVLLDRRSARPGWRDGLAYLGMAAIVAMPWYVAIALREPQFVRSFFWTHNVVRFLQPFDHEEPVWFYVPGLVLGLLPWALLIPGMVRFLARRDVDTANRRGPGLGFFLLAAGWTVAFFSAAGCKRAVYLLPALPPLALALGYYLNLLLPTGLSAFKALQARGSKLAGRATVSIVLVGLVIAGAATLKGLLQPMNGLVLAIAALVAAACLLCNPRRASWAACAVATFAVLYIGVRELQPAYNRQFALRSELRKQLSPAHREATRVACYPQRWDSVSFYLPQANIKVYRAEDRKHLLDDLRSRPDTLLLVKSGRSLRELLDDLPDSVEFVTRGRQGVVTAGYVRARDAASTTRYARLERFER